jgi:putative oxidoreductase
MNNSTISRIGVILYALVIGFFGVNHFMHSHDMKTMIPSYFPGDVVWVYITGAAFILAALAFLVGKQVRLAGLLLAALLVIIIVTIHLPGVINGTDPNALPSLLKDLALTGAALVIAGMG